MNTNWKELFLKSRTVFHCETEEIANEFLKIAHDLGYKWWNGETYFDNNCWFLYEEMTCYNINESMYDECEYYNELCYEIINVKDIITGKRLPFKLNRK